MKKPTLTEEEARARHAKSVTKLVDTAIGAVGPMNVTELRHFVTHITTFVAVHHPEEVSMITRAAALARDSAAREDYYRQSAGAASTS